MKLLIVDDYAPFRTSLRLLLEAGCQVREAGTAERALEVLAQDDDYDLLLVDQQLPLGTGLELCETVRARHPALEGRMVLMSGGSLDAAQWALADRAALHVLAKPFGMLALEPLLAEGRARRAR